MSIFLVLQTYNAEPQDELMPQAATIDAIDDLKYVFDVNNIIFSLIIGVLPFKISNVLVGSGGWQSEPRFF